MVHQQGNGSEAVAANDQVSAELHLRVAPARTQETSIAKVSVGTHFFLQNYLYAFATQAEVVNHVRTQAMDEEVQRLPGILQNWEEKQTLVTSLVSRELGIAETIEATELEDLHRGRLDRIAENKLFQRTFGNLPVQFGLVEIDKIIAAQRTVNLDYVGRLVRHFPKEPTTEELVEICLSPVREIDPIQHLEIGPNTHVFSSPNSDIRFLGAFVKDLADDDLRYAVMGGLPAAAIIAFVGYGGASINAIEANGRIILNNGFHRVFALRSIGVERIPMVLQVVRNAQLEMPPHVAGLPRDYLLGHPRPVLLKDFFEPGFVVTLKVKDRMRMVTVAVALNQHDVPA